ncbi:type I-E CRISPR-associated protein Cse1/CasA [Bordetella genomosp. 13]|uniref:type I-E CRISPR-associated protein Cse1/CasA n=1 Tax=Bordetella genomosp. 13 TaxID=463040 RepID=UPI00119CB06B|nr:type I-E CRISPR-associated protein Cse1/CasA [Bordetella genomosp. 13]
MMQPALMGNLLDERILTYRTVAAGTTVAATLPELFVALARDEVRDFPALRFHQRHPWHALLVHIAALALLRAAQDEPFKDSEAWRHALLALTPNDPDGASWCLASPPDRPAFLQAAVPDGDVSRWKNELVAADELDMLVTSKNHDLKTSSMVRCTAQDWCYALVSLQTQEGFLGAGNYGISRMNGGFASRCGIGIQPSGGLGKRWRRDICALREHRGETAETLGLAQEDGIALIWLLPWDGETSLSVSRLDPWYIEICRRVRLQADAQGRWRAKATGSKVARIAAKELNGVTGDAWMPIDISGAKALTITSRGFDYRLASELLFGGKYSKPPAQKLRADDGTEGVTLVAQGITRGQGKTEGYHERHIPISPTMRAKLLIQHTDPLAKVANERIEAISDVRRILWSALVVLFMNAAKDETGRDRDAPDSIKDRATRYARLLEADEDARFFADLIEEIESDSPAEERSRWLRGLALRAETLLLAAFDAGPRSGMLRYRAQANALAKLNGMLRSEKNFEPMATALNQKKDDLREGVPQ